jgi:hypothetical protein
LLPTDHDDQRAVGVDDDLVARASKCPAARPEPEAPRDCRIKGDGVRAMLGAARLHNPLWRHGSELPTAGGTPAALEDQLRTRLSGGGMGDDHALVRCREQGEGRVFYTALGHASEAYENPDFLAHLRGGINCAAGPGWSASR